LAWHLRFWRHLARTCTLVAFAAAAPDSSGAKSFRNHLETRKVRYSHQSCVQCNVPFLWRHLSLENPWALGALLGSRTHGGASVCAIVLGHRHCNLQVPASRPLLRQVIKRNIQTWHGDPSALPFSHSAAPSVRLADLFCNTILEAKDFSGVECGCFPWRLPGNAEPVAHGRQEKKKEIAALFKASQIVRILQLGQRYCSLLAPVSHCVSYERDSLQKDRAWSP